MLFEIGTESQKTFRTVFSTAMQYCFDLETLTQCQSCSQSNFGSRTAMALNFA